MCRPDHALPEVSEQWIAGDKAVEDRLGLLLLSKNIRRETGAKNKELPITHVQWLRNFLSSRQSKRKSTEIEPDKHRCVKVFLKGQ